MVYIFFDKFLRRFRRTLAAPHTSSNYLRCPLCGEPWVGLMRHLILHHRLTAYVARKLYRQARPCLKEDSE